MELMERNGWNGIVGTDGMELMERNGWNGMEREWFFIECVSIPFLFGNGPFHFSKNHCMINLKKEIYGLDSSATKC
ncbi:hypothetical protein BpHYR1_010199 [Brachionus plicatilis]|uniref:Uncharacterized protein n=1 Tax=Brachionus plicatilis TaxID=10195 RepID=A0A3M7R0P2_BRAPC|nr:hypothetical protein BpHYR1_010199 [Brachionus plicatilis]